MIALDEVVRALAVEVARAVVAELRAGDAPGMIDQSASPLGRRRHIAAVRRRVADGDGSAAIIGRRHLLSRDALDVEIASASKRSPRKVEAVDELGALRERYGLSRAS